MLDLRVLLQTVFQRQPETWKKEEKKKNVTKTCRDYLHHKRSPLINYTTTAALRAVMTICQVTQLHSDVTQVIETSVKAAAMEPTGSPPLTGQKKEKNPLWGETIGSGETWRTYFGLTSPRK